ncbi:MAG: CinA family protein [Sulfurovum sp.]|uniref:CinA family protein n=1 Tax=Sulfurovum sp. TaxID=1969726 RepID=UPI002867CBC3|nr:CinA family protein [Sulfurovum sp.]MCO4845888.1 CinA family protein [Sulfurovum sp.]
MKNIQDAVEKIIQKLTKEEQTISFAESCTGGRIAAAFTAISGASNVLHGSCVTYSNDIKHLWLGVDNEVLEKFGAVSKPCVVQMLEGIQKMAASDYAIAVSGIAGPTGGTELKPVGTVYIGVQTPFVQEVFHCNFNGPREAVQEQSTVFAIEKLAEVLEI